MLVGMRQVPVDRCRDPRDAAEAPGPCCHDRPRVAFALNELDQLGDSLCYAYRVGPRASG